MSEQNEGKMKILEMLSSGAITPDEALKLLQEFNEEQIRGRSRHHRRPGRPMEPTHPHADPRQINPDKPKVFIHADANEEMWEKFGEQFEHFEAMGEHFETMGEQIGAKVEKAFAKAEKNGWHIDIDIPFVRFGGGVTKTVNYTSGPIAQNIAGLKLIGKNAPVEIIGYDGQEVRITCTYKSKRRSSADATCSDVFVNEDDGHFEVLYDYGTMRSMHIYCEVPRAFIEEIHAESKNSNIKLKGVKGRNFNILTSNSSIGIEEANAHEIVAKSRNGGIYAERVIAGALSFDTTNSKITAEYVAADTAHFTTTNSKVDVEDADIKQLYVKTSNSGIKLENIFQNFAETGGERAVEAHTTNGGVSVYVPKAVGAMLQASTTNSRVDCQLQDDLEGEVSKHYIHAKTRDYDMAAAKARINISTTNASIKIRES